MSSIPTVEYHLSHNIQYGRVLIDRRSCTTTTAEHKKIWSEVQKELKSNNGKTLLRKLKPIGDIYVAASGVDGIEVSVKGDCWSRRIRNAKGKLLTLRDQNGKTLSAIIKATEDMGKNITSFFEQCHNFLSIKNTIR
ncbi:MAG: hypothetical protein MJ180_05040 [Candidatus Gastranaerophilales bacterium]|nr:hypothetical protein [Candidatus Gastranaerophilales bacterium]